MGERNHQFLNHTEWINKASSWLGRLKYSMNDDKDTRKEAQITCFDTKGRVAYIGKQFIQANEENTYPIKFFNDGQVAEFFADNPDIWQKFLDYQGKYWTDWSKNQ